MTITAICDYCDRFYVSDNCNYRDNRNIAIIAVHIIDKEGERRGEIEGRIKEERWREKGRRETLVERQKGETYEEK